MGPFDDFGATVRQYERVLLNFFMRKGVSFSDGEDLAQQTFVRLWNYRGRYEQTAKFTTFLFLVAGQVALDFFRAQVRKRKLEEGFEQACAMMPNRGATPLVGEDVRHAVRQLDAPYRDVVELGVFQDMPYAQVSEILSIPVGTVKSRMHYALKKLKEELEK